MVMLNANIILRYLLNDNEQMADEVEKIKLFSHHFMLKQDSDGRMFSYDKKVF